MHPDNPLDNASEKQPGSRQPARHGERGAVAAETVVAVPLLLFLLLLIVQFAIAWHAQHIAQTAASRALAVTRAQGGTVTAGRAQGKATLDALGSSVLLDPHVTVTRTDRAASIDVHGWAEQVVPGFHVPVSAHDAGPVDRWSPPLAKR